MAGVAFLLAETCIHYVCHKRRPSANPYGKPPRPAISSNVPIFWRQYRLLVAGNAECEHPVWPCQKQPFTFEVATAISGLPGRSLRTIAVTLGVQPLANGNSFVSSPRTRAITRLRVSRSNTSAIQRATRERRPGHRFQLSILYEKITSGRTTVSACPGQPLEGPCWFSTMATIRRGPSLQPSLRGKPIPERWNTKSTRKR